MSEIEDGGTKKPIGFLLQQNAAKTKEIFELRSEVCSLEQRITLQERYSSKDSFIFENLPWDGKPSQCTGKLFAAFRGIRDTKIEKSRGIQDKTSL